MIPAFFLYGEPLRTPDERTVHVETIAARSHLHAWNIRPHRHRDLQQILLVQRGRIEASLDVRNETLRAPAVIIVPPDTVHAFRFQEHTLGLVVSFGSELAREIASPTRGLLEFLKRPAAYSLDRAAIQATDLERLAAMLLREFARSAPGRNLALSGLLGALLANVLRLAPDYTAAEAPGETREQEIVARYRHLIERRYLDHAGISDYAHELGTSEARLRRCCVAVSGQSPMELLHQRLLVEAARQLRYTSMTVTQVAYFLGFEDPAYFSRFFTLRMRMSPRRFRQRQGGSLRA